MSLFTSMNTGVSGLQASQSGLNTTAHNLANTKTDGYTRQQNINTDMTYQNIKVNTSGTLQVGSGTTVSTVRQIRDIFLDKEYRLEISRQTFYEAQVESEEEVEDILGETEGVEFQDAMQDIWDSIQNLSTNPESIVNRELFLSQCESFLEKAQNVYSALTDYQSGLNTAISSQVASINSIAEQIAKYNQLISKAEASGVENANDYRDARNELMDELATYTYYTYNEDSDGKVTIYVDNAPLVMENKSYHMGCELIESQVYDEDTDTYYTSTASNMYKVVWVDNGYGDVYDLDEAYSSTKKTDTGSLLGLLTARGTTNATYADIPTLPQESDYYDASGVLTADGAHEYAVAMKEYEDAVEEYNNTTGNSILTNIEAQFDTLINAIVTAINDAFAPNVTADSFVTSGGADVTVSGTTSDGSTITLDADTSYKILDVNNCAVGADDDGTMGTEVFTRTGTDRYTVITLTSQVYYTDDDGNRVAAAQDNGDGTYSLYVYNEENTNDKSTMYTLSNLQMNSELLANYSLLAVKANPSTGNTGAYDQDVYTNLLAAWQADSTILDPNDKTLYSFDDYYTQMVGDLGTQGSVWQSMVDNQTSLTESIENQRQEISGVSTDEELVSLLTYQHAYNAASRYINVVNEMLEYLIERLG